MSSSVSQLDISAVDAYLTKHVKGYIGPLSANKFPDGQSNPTFKLTTPNATFVLRRKPPGILLKSAHAVEREFKVQRALFSSDVPVVRTLCLCEDTEIIGSEFYVMEYVDGSIHFDPRLGEIEKRKRAFFFNEMSRVLAKIHSVDLDACGLKDFGASGNYIARQVARWARQYKASQTGSIPEMNQLIAELEEHVLAGFGEAPSTLVHGDYRIDNIIFSESGDILAVLDWELSTIGDPIADLASVIMQWRMPTGLEGRGLAGVDRSAEGLPSDAEFIEAYCAARNVSGIANFRVYLAFAFFRMAAILQGVKKRAIEGNASNPEHGLRMGEQVPVFAAKGLEALSAKEFE